jgi:ribose 5-phosphate isomerase A
MTDNGNLILDTTFAAIDTGLSSALHEIPGVLEHGLFLQIAAGAIIGGSAGVRILGVVE